MALEQLKQIKGLLEGSAEAGKLRLDKKDRTTLARERDKMARNLHKKLEILQEIMKHPTIGGKLNLGTNVEMVNWSLMPQSVAKCFRPEFDYQPEEITQFYAQSSTNKSSQRISRYPPRRYHDLGFRFAYSRRSLCDRRF